MNSGFITIHRKLMEWYGASSPYRLSLWVHLLMLANHEENTFVFNGEPVTVKRGQFITGRKKLSVLTGISESYVEKLLKEFEKQGNLEQQKTNRNRLITITKYSVYQNKEQQKDNQETTKRQPRDTNNNDNNDNNVTSTRVSRGRFAPPSVSDVKHYIKEKSFQFTNAVNFVDYYEARGWKLKGNVPMKDWKATVRTWENRGKPQKSSGNYFDGKDML